MPSTHPCVLVFAASDPSSGAGIQADLLALAGLGCHPLTALTALTVQNTCGIENVVAVDPDLLERQARLMLADCAVHCFKIGALGSTENVIRIASILSEHPGIPLVFDPVLRSGRGDPLADAKMIKAMRELLLPRTTLLTPNVPEALYLSGRTNAPISANLAEGAQRLIAAGARHVLITGTHQDTPQVINSLYGANGLLRQDIWPRLPGEYHGSGCTLASAIAAFMAHGQAIEMAVRNAQEYTWQTLAHAFSVGRGQSIPNRLFHLTPFSAS